LIFLERLKYGLGKFQDTRTKNQDPNKFQAPMTKIINLFGIWVLVFIWFLEVWYLEFFTNTTNYTPIIPQKL
jgi:hypothetical protein